MRPIATAKANGTEPHAWRTDVPTRLPTTKDRAIDALLPPAQTVPPINVGAAHACVLQTSRRCLYFWLPSNALTR